MTIRRSLWPVLVVLALLGAATAHAAPDFLNLLGFNPLWKRTINVDCDRRQSLGRALLRHTVPGTTIRVSGTCREQIVIRTSWVTIKARGSASIDGAGLPSGATELNPLVLIEGAAGVSLEGLVVENSQAEGILLRDGASASFSDLTVRNNANAGIFVDQSDLKIENLSSTGNFIGIDHVNAASSVFSGDIDLTGNGFFGLGAAGASAVELRGAALDVSANGVFGLIIEGAHLSIFNFGASLGSRIMADQNPLCGMIFTGYGRLDVLAPQPFHHTGTHTISASNNGDCGIWLPHEGSIESPFGAAVITITGNQVGLRAEGGSGMFVVGGLRANGNATHGLLADGAGVVSIASSPGDANPSDLSGNGADDVALSFGSRATFDANVGSIVCDDTALARGSATCP